MAKPRDEEGDIVVQSSITPGCNSTQWFCSLTILSDILKRRNRGKLETRGAKIESKVYVTNRGNVGVNVAG